LRVGEKRGGGVVEIERDLGYLLGGQVGRMDGLAGFKLTINRDNFCPDVTETVSLNGYLHALRESSLCCGIDLPCLRDGVIKVAPL
jgi:hypothetical protein